MKYRVQFAGEFKDNIRDQIDYLRSRHVSEERIERWFRSLFDRLRSLGHTGTRHERDPVQSAAIGEPSYKVVHGDYLVFYRIDEKRKRLSVDHFVHGARDRRLERGMGRSASDRRSTRDSARPPKDDGREH